MLRPGTEPEHGTRKMHLGLLGWGARHKAAFPKCQLPSEPEQLCFCKAGWGGLRGKNRPSCHSAQLGPLSVGPAQPSPHPGTGAVGERTPGTGPSARERGSEQAALYFVKTKSTTELSSQAGPAGKAGGPLFPSPCWGPPSPPQPPPQEPWGAPAATPAGMGGRGRPAWAQALVSQGSPPTTLTPFLPRINWNTNQRETLSSV